MLCGLIVSMERQGPNVFYILRSRKKHYIDALKNTRLLMTSPEDDSRAQGCTARLAHLRRLPACQPPRVLAAVAVRCHGMCTFAGVCVGDDQ